MMLPSNSIPPEPQQSDGIPGYDLKYVPITVGMNPLASLPVFSAGETTATTRGEIDTPAIECTAARAGSTDASGIVGGWIEYCGVDH